MKKVKKISEKFILFLNKKYGITPDVLVYIKIFSAPLLALLISKVISNRSLLLAIIVLIIYIKVVAIDFYAEILAHMAKEKNNTDHLYGSILDKMSGKILLILVLIPFGLNLYTFLIILAESIWVFQNIHSPLYEKQRASRAEKIKIWLQIVLIPILILQRTTSFIPGMLVYLYIITTIVFTYIPIYTNYFYFEK